ncbi:MAG: hypothetical protein MOGMAGMI_00353 [Candidatus Omnitrophica bacterium]|nr:hypothetical protein [Candidatus Omnitrophota bacterium]
MEVKIKLKKGQSIEEAKLQLLKALETSLKSDHLDESFEDPAMDDTYERVFTAHAQIYEEMMDEIIDALEDEYKE